MTVQADFATILINCLEMNHGLFYHICLVTVTDHAFDFCASCIFVNASFTPSELSIFVSCVNLPRPSGLYV